MEARFLFQSNSRESVPNSFPDGLQSQGGYSETLDIGSPNGIAVRSSAKELR